jgi:hypothetical protein
MCVHLQACTQPRINSTPHAQPPLGRRAPGPSRLPRPPSPPRPTAPSSPAGGGGCARRCDVAAAPPCRIRRRCASGPAPGAGHTGWRLRAGEHPSPHWSPATHSWVVAAVIPFRSKLAGIAVHGLHCYITLSQLLAMSGPSSAALLPPTHHSTQPFLSQYFDTWSNLPEMKG